MDRSASQEKVPRLTASTKVLSGFGRDQRMIPIPTIGYTRAIQTNIDLIVIAGLLASISARTLSASKDSKPSQKRLSHKA